MTKIFRNDPALYQAFAEDYYEMTPPLSAIAPIYAHQPLTEQMIKALNNELSLTEVEADVIEIGYPCDGV
jgi:hypothetical protein